MFGFNDAELKFDRVAIKVIGLGYVRLDLVRLGYILLGEPL